MMNEARPYASLSSGLLARKGAAKPAMRPQGFTGFEDLGWNDMGYAPGEEWSDAPAEHVPSSIAALTPAPRTAPPAETEPADQPAEPAEETREAGKSQPVETAQPAEEERREAPVVVAQQRAILERFEGEEGSADVPARARTVAAKIVPLTRTSARVVGKKAAFTLRLDSQRHVRLRLAAAVLGRSAQQIVTAALDEALAALPEIEALAARIPASGTKRN